MDDQSDQPPDRPDDRSRVPLTEAADQLGLSVEGTRSRCRRGTLRCQHLSGGGWVVDLTDQETSDRPVDHAIDRPETGPDQAPTGQEAGSLVALLERQTQQIAELSAAAALWQERARYLGERLQALEAGPVAGDVTDMPQDVIPGPPRNDQPEKAAEHGSMLERLWRRIRGG